MDKFIDCMDFEDKKWSMDLSGYFFWFDFCYSKNTSIRVIRFKSLSVIRPCLRQPFLSTAKFFAVDYKKTRACRGSSVCGCVSR